MVKVNLSTDKNVLDFRTLVEGLAKASELPKSKVQVVLKGLGPAFAVALKQGKNVRIPGLGVLRVRDVPAKLGEAKGAAASKKIVLAPAKQLKAEIFGN